MNPQKRTKQRKAAHPSGVERYVEWQDKQYLPGYYTGGRIPPIFFGKRPNRFGYLLLVTGALTLLVTLLGGWTTGAVGLQPEGWPRLFTSAMIALLQIVAGWRLLQPPQVKK